MIRFIISRFIILAITLWVIITISFFLVRAVPGNPFVGDGRQLSDTEISLLMQKYNLDKPLSWQYVNYLNGLVHGDLGYSYKLKDFSVSKIIAISAPASVSLALMSVFLAVLIGMSIGIISAFNRNTYIDYSLMSVAMIGIVFPAFVLGPMFALFFGIYLHILPVAGWIGWETKIMPVVVLALLGVPAIARLTRGSILEILNSNYVRTAYAKGLPTRIIVTRHLLKPVLIPLVTILGPAIASLMGGSVITESIFDIPGLGRYLVQAAMNRDYNLVLGLVIFYATLVLLLNFLCDILYSFLDPRIKTIK